MRNSRLLLKVTGGKAQVEKENLIWFTWRTMLTWAGFGSLTFASQPKTADIPIIFWPHWIGVRQILQGFQWRMTSSRFHGGELIIRILTNIFEAPNGDLQTEELQRIIAGREGLSGHQTLPTFSDGTNKWKWIWYWTCHLRTAKCTAWRVLTTTRMFSLLDNAEPDKESTGVESCLSGCGLVEVDRRCH